MIFVSHIPTQLEEVSNPVLLVEDKETTNTNSNFYLDLNLAIGILTNKKQGLENIPKTCPDNQETARNV